MYILHNCGKKDLQQLRLSFERILIRVNKSFFLKTPLIVKAVI